MGMGLDHSPAVPLRWSNKARPVATYRGIDPPDSSRTVPMRLTSPAGPRLTVLIIVCCAIPRQNRNPLVIRRMAPPLVGPRLLHTILLRCNTNTHLLLCSSCASCCAPQGLQVCLGASARATGRGSSQGRWVMAGKRTATVTLEIWNTGRPAEGEEGEDGDEEDGDDDEGLQQKWPPFQKHLWVACGVGAVWGEGHGLEAFGGVGRGRLGVGG